MDEPGSRNSSLQRKKPPWLKLDIPTIQLTPDDTPTLTPVRKHKSQTHYDVFYLHGLMHHVFACVTAGEAPAQCQHAGGKPSDLHGCLGNFQ